jgi:hypothetical protein
VDNQFRCDPVGDRAQVGKITEAAGATFGQLYDAIDCFNGSLGNAALEIADDAGPVLLECFSEFAEWDQSAARCPSTPMLEQLRAFRIASFIDILQRGSEGPRLVPKLCSAARAVLVFAAVQYPDSKGYLVSSIARL